MSNENHCVFSTFDGFDKLTLEFLTGQAVGPEAVWFSFIGLTSFIPIGIID